MLSLQRKLAFKQSEIETESECIWPYLPCRNRVMAPFTPFLTEHMYQRLRMLVSGQQGKDKASVHYLMIPQARDDLIDVDIER